MEHLSHQLDRQELRQIRAILFDAVNEAIHQGWAHAAFRHYEIEAVRVKSADQHSILVYWTLRNDATLMASDICLQ